MTAATVFPRTAAITEPPNLNDLVARLGGISLSRILIDPAPGTATEADVPEAERRYNRRLRIDRSGPRGERHGIL